MKVAFLGLGVMGYPMAGHLKKKGHDVTVYNRTARAGREMGGRIRRNRGSRRRAPPRKDKRSSSPASAMTMMSAP